MRKVLLITSAVFALAASLLSPAASAEAQSDYIVVFKNNASAEAKDDSIKKSKGQETTRFNRVLNGSVVKMTQSQAKAIANDPNVQSVEADAAIYAVATQTAPPSWGLDRIDQSILPLNSTYNYPDSAGTGVKAYIVDTGISKISDLATGNTSRVLPGCSVFPAFREPTVNTTCEYQRVVSGKTYTRSTIDDNGHGTHVSGTVAGTKYGVAKKAQLVPVKVLNSKGSGSWAGFIAGLDWIANQYCTTSGCNANPMAVVNASIGGPSSAAADEAVNKLVAKGFTIAVAAGNSTVDACTTSPSAAANALTVGAVDSTDNIAYFSNYGNCVDIFAPGVNIVSDTPSGSYATMSGTSMASPHVTGVAALILGAGVYKTPAEVAATIDTSASAGKLTFGTAAAKSPNKLLQAPK